MIRIPMKMLTIAAFSVALASWQFAIAAEDMPGMDHSSMQNMDQASSTTNTAMPMSDKATSTRDPHAYADGYDFGVLAPPQMADQTSMGGIRVNRLERARSSNSSHTMYDFMGWVGKDYDQLLLESEGEASSGKLQESRSELLWGHALAAYWNTQLGARYDSGVAPGQSWLAIGVQGIAPYWFDIEAAAYVGDQGRTALRLGAEYELLLTQKLILQPRVEANFYGKQDAARELGSGLSNLLIGLRLRYEIRRELAPYLGVEWNGKFSGTADFARAANMQTKETRVVAGVRFWF